MNNRYEARDQRPIRRYAKHLMFDNEKKVKLVGKCIVWSGFVIRQCVFAEENFRCFDHKIHITNDIPGYIDAIAIYSCTRFSLLFLPTWTSKCHFEAVLHNTWYNSVASMVASSDAPNRTANLHGCIFPTNFPCLFQSIMTAHKMNRLFAMTPMVAMSLAAPMMGSH